MTSYNKLIPYELDQPPRVILEFVEAVDACDLRYLSCDLLERLQMEDEHLLDDARHGGRLRRLRYLLKPTRRPALVFGVTGDLPVPIQAYDQGAVSRFQAGGRGSVFNFQRLPIQELQLERATSPIQTRSLDARRIHVQVQAQLVAPVAPSTTTSWNCPCHRAPARQ